MRRWRRRSPHRSATVLAHLAPGQRATITGAAPHAAAAVVDRLWQLGFRPASRVDVSAGPHWVIRPSTGYKTPNCVCAAPKRS